MVVRYWEKLLRKWTKLRLTPIRVFCFHQVSDEYDEKVYCRPDWIPTSFIKDYLEALIREGYEFISLDKAYAHIQSDVFRRKKYAVLTADDGLKCQLALMPWLEQHHIPLTLFFNVDSVENIRCGYPVRKWFNIKNNEQNKHYARLLYLLKEDLMNLNNANVYIGVHGFAHEMPVTMMTDEEFDNDIQICLETIGRWVHFVPFYAYVYGAHNKRTDAILNKYNLVPVLADGQKNYNDKSCIHREILEHEFSLWQKKF